MHANHDPFTTHYTSSLHDIISKHMTQHLFKMWLPNNDIPIMTSWSNMSFL
uniref:Uncharacterized protein n=1 Tax=Arion vulgaris TaxID=1028688 RepID=A0A0B6ZVG2_9EUPU